MSLNWIEVVSRSNREAREFWLIMMGVGLVSALLMLWRHRPNIALVLGGVSATFALLALTTPKLLEPVRMAWMAFAHKLGWVNTQVLLGIFYLIFMTPLAVFMRWVGRDEMKRRWPAANSSNWENHRARQHNERHYENMF